ncbi:M28 family peptidase [Actinomadura rupiterrae]|uniref:M28 family peptidase n=1 Tax=Actinomadura rupiterrae TaxID=559627 RepID=UPI0020A303D4|nr:M28 family peptidase [Actinomadura rupiterrae]MCP2338319.1 Zn-dependent M28 family amino/carboxypeptidase [Actinomadura rupiterrae]
MDRHGGRHRRRAVAVLAAAALAAGLATAAHADAGRTDTSSNTKLARKLVREVTADNAWRHLQALQKIADRNKGIRASGTRGHVASAEYVESRLHAAGYRTTRQPFTHDDFVFIASEGRVVAPSARTLHPLVARFSANTPEGGLTAPLAVVPFAGDATPGCEPSDYAGADYTGKIALIPAGGCGNTVKQKTAAAAGAAAALINTNNPNPDMILRTRLTAADVKIPVASIGRGEADALAADARSGPVTLTVDLRGRATKVDTFNVIAETPTGRAGNVVMLGAHLDSVTEGPGINDNGSSSAMELETALQLARHFKQVRNKVRFAWWGAEEHGDLGSGAYVAQLSDREKADLALYLNFDMIGSPNYARMVYDGDDSDHEGAGPGPEGSAQIEKVITGFHGSRGLPTVGRDFDGRSDYGPFIAAGIPAGGETSGSNLIKTEEWARLFGGKAGQSLDWCYHSACDTVRNVNRTIFGQLGAGMAWATGRFALDISDVTGDDPVQRAHARAKAPKPLVHLTADED